MAEEIVTRFTADLTDLQAKVKQATSTLEGYTETADEAGNAIGAQGKKVGDLEAKTKTLVATEQALAKAAKEAAEQSEAIGDAAAGVNALGAAEAKAAKEAARLANEQKKAAGATKQVADQAPRLTVFQRISQGISRSFQSAAGSVRAFGQGAREGFRTAISDVGKLRTTARGATEGLDAAGISTGRFGGALRALASPIGLVAAAVGGLLLNLTRLDSVQDGIEKLKAGFTSFLDSLAGNATLEDTIAGIREAVELAERLDALNDRAIFNSVRVTRQRADAAVLERQARNRTLTEQERIGLLTQANTLLEQAANTDLTDNIERAEIAYRDLVRSIKQQNPELSQEFRNTLDGFDTLTQEAAARILGLQTAGFNVSPELLQQAANLRNQIVRDETEVTLLRERNENRIDALREASARERQEREQKAAEAREKALERERARLAELAKLRAQASGIRTDIEREQLRTATLGEDGAPTLSTQLLDIDFAQEDALAQAGAIFAQAEAADKGHADELAKIEEEKAATLLAIRAKYDAQAKAAYDKFYADEGQAAKASRAAVTDALLSDTDRQLNAISKKYDELLKLTDKLTVNEAEKGRIRAQLLLARERELTEIIDDEGRKRLEIQVRLIEELGEGVGQALALLATSFSIGENDINAQFDQQLSDLQEANQRELDEIARRNGSQAELEEARNKATASYMDERNRIEQDRGRELQENRERQEKEFLKLLIDTLEKVVQIYVAEVIVKQIVDGATQGGVPGALAGAAIGAAIAAIISGIFSALKSSIGGAYRGEEMIGGPAFFSGSRDTHLRRVHPKERIISADKNVKHYDVLHAIHTDKFDQWKRANLMLEMPAMDNRVMPEINRYLDGDTGQRMAASVMLMKYHDKNIVESTNRTTKAQQKTNVLLEQLVEAVTNKPGRGAHYW